jgi:hypothetical protein
MARGWDRHRNGLIPQNPAYYQASQTNHKLGIHGRTLHPSLRLEMVTTASFELKSFNDTASSQILELRKPEFGW